jgi:hypothetical protein
MFGVREFESQQGLGIFLFSNASRPTLITTQGQLYLLYMFACLLTYLLTYLLTQPYRIFFETLIATQIVKKYSFFMEPEGSSPCSEKPAT